MRYINFVMYSVGCDADVVAVWHFRAMFILNETAAAAATATHYRYTVIYWFLVRIAVDAQTHT